MVTLADITDPAPAPTANDWNAEGVVFLPNALDEQVMSDYEQCWLDNAPDRRGWPYATPYMDYPALRTLVCQPVIADALHLLMGEPAGVHLNLTGWESTTRDWHQDSYLNPAHVGDYYAAVWIALDRIHPDSGPFQYIPGSHRWPQVTQAHMGRYLDLDDPLWPTQSEAILTPLWEEEIARRGELAVNYTPTRGDVLIWHGRLLHRGSKPKNPALERRALIAHYSGLNHREDMPDVERDPAGGHFFVLGGKQPVR